MQAAAGTVIDPDPIDGAADPNVSVRGIDATTGTLRWQLPAMHLVGDVPLVCGNGEDFCIPTSRWTDVRAGRGECDHGPRGEHGP